MIILSNFEYLVRAVTVTLFITYKKSKERKCTYEVRVILQSVCYFVTLTAKCCFACKTDRRLFAAKTVRL